MVRLPFRLTLDVTLDGSGNGAIRFSPSIGMYMVEQVAAMVSSNENEPEFQVYVDGIFVGGSYSGSRTNDTSFNQRLAAQQVLNGVWIGGDPGATAVMNLTGWKET
jgi:hypothetical protein